MKRRSFLKLSTAVLGVSVMPSFLSAKEGEKMKIAILAASGKAGKLITKEALNQGFEVASFVRNASKMSDINNANLKVVQKDILELSKADLQGFDAIISAFGVTQNTELYDTTIKHLTSILQGNSAKFLVVGGAGSLYMDKDKKTQLIDTPDFPDAYKPVAKAHNELLSYLRTQDSLNWVYVSPAAVFVYDAPKTGKYKIIGEFFEVNDKGESKISYADYATALLEIMKDDKINKQRVGVIGL